MCGGWTKALCEGVKDDNVFGPAKVPIEKGTVCVFTKAVEATATAATPVAAATCTKTAGSAKTDEECAALNADQATCEATTVVEQVCATESPWNVTTAAVAANKDCTWTAAKTEYTAPTTDDGKGDGKGDDDTKDEESPAAALTAGAAFAALAFVL